MIIKLEQSLNIEERIVLTFNCCVKTDVVTPIIMGKPLFSYFSEPWGSLLCEITVVWIAQFFFLVSMVSDIKSTISILKFVILGLRAYPDNCSQLL